MPKRLQVILNDSDYRDVQRAARSRRMSIAQWVRQAIRLARRQEPLANTSRKLQAIRAAAQFRYPSGDIEQMLAEIDKGYAAESQQ